MFEWQKSNCSEKNQSFYQFLKRSFNAFCLDISPLKPSWYYLAAFPLLAFALCQILICQKPWGDSSSSLTSSSTSQNCAGSFEIKYNMFALFCQKSIQQSAGGNWAKRPEEHIKTLVLPLKGSFKMRLIL